LFQFAPLKKAIGKKAFREGYFPGTLFRLPLRKTPSTLSDTIYTKEEVVKLFCAFQGNNLAIEYI
jgi:hypothetical protein